MRVTVPLSAFDTDLLLQWVETHQYLKTAGQNHQLFIVSVPSQAGAAADAKAALTDLFESVTVHVMDQEPYGGHPKAPNMHFWACANLMFRDNPNVPWQLVELDCLPIRANAYDAIAGKYASCGAPFFGHIDKTPFRHTEQFLRDQDTGAVTTVINPNYGKLAISNQGDKDVMMSGCAVYPGNMIMRDNLKGLMEDFMKGQMSPSEAWDIHLRSAMARDGMSATNLIASMWNTENYRLQDGQIVCDSRKSHEIFERNPNWELRQCGGPVHPDAVLIHGCKDDSLFKLITTGQIPNEIYAKPRIVQQEVASVSQSSAAPPAPQDTSRLDRLEAIVLKMHENIMALKPTISAAPNAVPGEPERAMSSASAHETKETADSILNAILAELSEVGNKQMLSKLSAKLCTKKDKLKEAVLASDKLSIKGPAEWVERIAA